MVEINGKNVRIFSDDKPNYVLIHPTGKHELDNISSVSCCSPSVWIEGWTEYTSTRNPMVKNIYLSIGSKENRTGNPVLRTVRERIEFQHEILTVNKINTSLEINHGNHFQDNIERVVKGYLWCLDNCD